MPPAKLISLFHAKCQGEPRIYALAPGRVNLIGEHTDYNDGYVFPAAIDKQVSALLAPSTGATRLFSEQTGEGQTFDAQTVKPGEVKGWTAYAAGMAWVLQEHTGVPLPNIQGVVSSTVPMGSGISSSAAIEMAFGVAWNQVAGLSLDNKTLALLAQRCENQFVGVNCGIMDQMASAMGKEGSAMFLDTQSLEIQYAPIPSDLAILVCDTKKPRALTESAYNERRSQCEQAARIMGLPSLREANPDLLQSNAETMSETVYCRARHVVTENDRCLKFKKALKNQDLNEIGHLLKASHESLRDDYEVSCRELDEMAEACWETSGCVGARMTGAGFGGACVALAKIDQLTEVISEVETSYLRRTGLDGEVMACRAVNGAQAFRV
ncbi:MAG: galactokinase [Chlorobia bacterium]|nr:galactokinase [Fimbriimonadaceae bacterium]